MREVKTVWWSNAFYIQTRACVTLNTFTTLLSGHFRNWTKEKEIKFLTEKKAEKIMRRELSRYWYQWPFDDWFFESYSPEEWDVNYFDVRDEVESKLKVLFPYLR